MKINPHNYAKLKPLLPESVQLQLKAFFPDFMNCLINLAIQSLQNGDRLLIFIN